MCTVSIDKNNWDKYLGWSQFEKKNLMPDYLKALREALDATNSKKIVVLGCGYGYPECLLLKEGTSIFGIDSNDYLLSFAANAGIDVLKQDAFSIEQNYNIHKIAHVLALPFISHHIPKKNLNSFYKNAKFLLKQGGILIALDPHANFEHIRAFDANTFRIPISKDGYALDSKNIDPERDEFLVEIHLNDDSGQNTIMRHEHKPLSMYRDALKSAGFQHIELIESGFQFTREHVLFPAYQIIIAR